MIKYILWDIDGTLLDFSLAEARSIEASFEEFGLGKPSEELLENYRQINKSYWQRLERGELEKIQVLEGRFYDLFDLYKLDSSLVPDFNKSYQENLGRVAAFSPYGLEVVKDLKGKYIQLAATNGTIVAQKGKLKRSGLDQLLDGIFISDLVGFEKPDPRFFQAILDEFPQSKLEEYIIVGDSLTSDIQLSKNCGFKNIFYNPKGLDLAESQVDYNISDLRQVKEIIEKINGQE
ncbi:MAG: HAD-IA family hydrolase [Bacillota bacterium]|nr:HAD-IA family hydrolase [Bacillota bacterium]